MAIIFHPIEDSPTNRHSVIEIGGGPLTAVKLHLVQAVFAAGDGSAGKAAFDNRCAACHTNVVGQNRFRLSLAQVIGRLSGGLRTHNYSSAMSKCGAGVGRGHARQLLSVCLLRDMGMQIVLWVRPGIFSELLYEWLTLIDGYVFNIRIPSK